MRLGTKIVLFGTLLLLIFGCTPKLPKVKIETSVGNIVVEIDTINAPVTATNFLNHVNAGTYKNAVFYRVVRMDNQPNDSVKIEVIQGGLLNDKEIDKVKPIRQETTKETGLKHLNGTISMARLKPGSASTEFFICINNQPELDFGGTRNADGQGFAAFGKVVKGMDIVHKIQLEKDKNQMLIHPVKILNIELLN